MIRLHIVVEGQTEKEFVDEVLVPALSPLGVIPDARCVATSRKGGRKYSTTKRRFGPPIMGL